MADNLEINYELSKAEKYRLLLPQLVALTEGEPNVIANAANIVAALKETFGFFWIGFYFVRTDSENEELVLGPFQGTVACTRIKKGKGVCGLAWELQDTIVVPDVDQFPGHISCNSFSRSEIVIPVIKDNIVMAVLDVDSDHLADFDAIDADNLKVICNLFASLL